MSTNLIEPGTLVRAIVLDEHRFGLVATIVTRASSDADEEKVIKASAPIPGSGWEAICSTVFREYDSDKDSLLVIQDLGGIYPWVICLYQEKTILLPKRWLVRIDAREEDNK